MNHLFSEKTVPRGRWVFIAEGIRRGYTFTKLFKQKFIFRAEKNGVGFIYKNLPSSLTNLMRPDFKELVRKLEMKKYFHIVNMNTPRDYGVIHSIDELSNISIKFPVVVKPNRGSFSRNVHLHQTSLSQVKKSVKDVIENSEFGSSGAIIEEMCFGRDFRIVFIDGKYTACVERRRAQVIGDGQHTIEQLVAMRNQELERGPLNDESFTNHYILIDNATKKTLRDLDLTPSSIPKDGHVVILKNKIDAGSGTDYIDCTKILHHQYKMMCEKFVKKHNIFIVGFDLITDDPSLNPLKTVHHFNEFNPLPFIDLNENNNVGDHQPISCYIWDALEARGDEIINADFPEF